MLVLMIWSGFGLAHEVKAATIYTNYNTGNDSTGDGSSGSPYKTFYKAYTVASTDDTLDLTGTFDWSNADEVGDVTNTGFTISKALTIQGQSADTTFIQADSTPNTAGKRVFTLNSATTLKNLTIRYAYHNISSYSGTAIYTYSPLTILDCVIDQNKNHANRYVNGAIFAGNTLVMRGSTMSNNENGYAGGIYYAGTTAEITNSTFYNNWGEYYGALYITGGSSVVTVTNSTFVNNRGQYSCTDICPWYNTVYIKNTIMANKQSGAANFNPGNGTVHDGGNNIVETQSGSAFTNGVNGNLVGDQANLNVDSGLSLNGSSTGVPTLALLENSVAINTGDPADGTHNGISIPETDQRGYYRAGSTDMGAYEYGGTLTIEEPTSQASNITFSSVSYNQMTINWSNGNGAKRAVFVKQANTGTASPVDDTTYTANTVFGSGTQIGSTGWYAVYSSTGTSVTVTGLTEQTDYIAQVFEYNGPGGVENYLTSTASNNPKTQTTGAILTPSTQAHSLSFSSIEYTQMTIGWTNGNGEKRAVFVKQANTGTTSPADNTTYTANTAFGLGTQIGSTGWYAVYNSTGTSVTVTGLTAGTDYIAQVFEYNGTAGIENYLTDTATNNPKYQASASVTEPGTQAHSLSFSSVQYTQMTVGWTNGSGEKRVVFVKQANTGTASPVDDTSYTANTALGSGTQIGSTGWYAVYNSTGTSVTVTGLTAGTDYIAQVFEYNESGAVINYNANTATNNPKTQASTSVLEPSTQAHSLSFSSVQYTQMTIGWTNGDGAKRAVFVKQADTGTAIPTDNTSYTANTTFGSGTQIDSTGWYAVYNSTGTSVTVTGLSLGTSYIAQVFEYNESGAVINYMTDLASNNPKVQATASVAEPTSQASLIVFSSVSSTQMTVSWTNGDGEKRAVFMKEASSGTALPVDDTTYTANTAFGSGTQISSSGWYAIYNDTSTSVAVTGLSPSTTYIAQVFEYNASGSTVNYFIDTATNNPKTQATTAAPTEITLGTGTSTNGTTTAAPLNTWYRSLHGQVVYTAAELNAAGVSGPINVTQLGFYVTSAPVYALPNFLVRMKHTNDSNVASWQSSTGLDTYYSVASYTPSAGDYDMLTLDEPFVWNGTDNIVVDTAFSQVMPTYSASGRVRYYSSASGFRYARSDGSNQTNVFSGGSSSSLKPQVKMAFQVIDSTPPTISSVEASPETNGATITWTTNEVGSTKINYGLTSSLGSATAETDTGTRVTSHSASISSLISCSSYYYQVVSSDEASNQGTGEIETFTTTGCTASASIDDQSSSALLATDVGGTTNLSSGGETVSLVVPSGYSGTPAYFQIKKLDKTTVLAVTSTPSSYSGIGNLVYEMRALPAVNTALTSFSEPLSMTMTYVASDVVGYDETSLRIYRWDGASWNALDSCSVDTSAKTVSCTTSSFSTFVLFGQAAAVSANASQAQASTTEPVNQASSCQDQKPIGIPNLFQIEATKKTAKLFFTPVRPVSEYVVSFGEGEETAEYAGSFETSQTDGVVSLIVSSLSPNRSYSFMVRGGNGCATGDWSNKARVTTVEPSRNLKINSITVGTDPPDRCEYVIKSEDTLWNIARDNLGNGSWYKQIIEKNKAEYPKLESSLKVGSTIRLPCLDDLEDQVKKYELKIKVLKNGRPMEGVLAELEIEGQSAWTTKDGKVKFVKLESGQYRLILSYKGYRVEHLVGLEGEIEGRDLVIEMKFRKNYTLHLISLVIMNIGVWLFFKLVPLRKRRVWTRRVMVGGKIPRWRQVKKK